MGSIIMSEVLNECAVCLTRFGTHDKLREHTWTFQTEITTLLARLQALLVHQWPEHKHKKSLVLDQDVEDEFDESDERQAVSLDTPISCPHEDCAQSEATFQRPQDMTRHYGTHCTCSEFCRLCHKTFEKPSTFCAHKCVTSAKTAADKKYLKMRATALRKKAIKHLDMAMAPTAYQQHQTPLWLSGECDPDRLGQNVITSTPIWLTNSSANFPTTSFQTDNLSVANSLQTGYQFDEVAYEG